MQTVTLRTRATSAGVIHLEISTGLANRDVEIVLVMHPLETALMDSMGYPLGYFEETYGMFADEPLERNQPSDSDALGDEA